ncbi:phosphate/phosphite/phosphonate ABC transporter substrate-binding protein [Pseudoxanthomonas sangjuensis]|uniref:phosphate/phosphite/phosphonate ABC transporter substrate-binding protein n=1 Tax=Pseudoxanthomonas sangjuensis TaxID=1503750 RepID=UPI003CCD9464
MKLRIAWIGLALAFSGMVADAAERATPPASGDDQRILVLGRISDDPKAHYEQLKPLLDYVVPRMRDVGITGGRILMARDPQQMTSYLRRSRVDWVTETAGNAMLLQQRAGAEPLLLTERNGVSRYHSVFFARRDSDISSLPDLKGRSIAFQSTASTSAYMVPAASLLDAGLVPEILLSPKDRPAPDTVGYVFARSEQNIAAWVHKRMVDAGVVSNLDWSNPQRVPAAFRLDLRIIAETEDYPRALEVVRGDLDPKVRERLREVLLQAADDPVARPALERFFGTTRFLPLDARTRLALERLRKDTMHVREQLE